MELVVIGVFAIVAIVGFLVLSILAKGMSK